MLGKMLLAVAACQASSSDTPAGPSSVTIHTDEVTHQISELAMGCHSDSGFEHQARSFYAQMIVPDSFNATGFTPSPHWGGNASTDGSFSSARVGWNVEKSAPSVAFAHGTDNASRFHGVASQQLSLAGKGSGGLSNRGLGNAGMAFEAGKPYEGFIWAGAAGALGVSVTVSLEDYSVTPNKVLATQTFTVQTTTAGNSTFQRYSFVLTPSASTSCVKIPYRSDPSILCGSHSANVSPRSFAADERLGHICVRCGGQFKISLSKPSSVLVNYVYLQPGPWGRVAGLPVLKTGADLLKRMGVKAIRSGGSYASGGSARGDPTFYQWQKWTGPAYSRPSRSNGVWGLDLLSGWGIFDVIDMCNALGIEPIITTTDTTSAEDFAGLVEYCWGNTTTPQGAKRVADGHPKTYNVKYFELGNEQYNSNYIEQVEAMEAKACELGIGKTLYYLFPSNNFLNDTDIRKAAVLQPRLDSQLLADVHIGDGGAVATAETLFSSKNISKAGLEIGAGNAETNDNMHTFVRAMTEAADLNSWFNAEIAAAAGANKRLHFRTASFCTASSNGFDNFDQGLSFFLPNATWLQPPGVVHSMIDQTWQPNALRVDVPNPPSGVWASQLRQSGNTSDDSVFSAQKSDDGKTLVLRFVNTHYRLASPAPATTLKVHLTGGMADASFSSTTMWILSSADPQAVNTAGQPMRVAPERSVLNSFGDGSVLKIPSNSYVIIVATLA